MMMKWLLLPLLLCAHVACLADMVVIVNADTPISNLSREQIADIFLGRTNSLPNKEKITPIENLENSDAYVEFHEVVTHKNTTQIKAHWAKMVFSGKSVPPRELAPEEAKRLVETNRNYITYIDKKWVSGKVKIIFEY